MDATTTSRETPTVSQNGDLSRREAALADVLRRRQAGIPEVLPGPVQFENGTLRFGNGARITQMGTGQAWMVETSPNDSKGDLGVFTLLPEAVRWAASADRDNCPARGVVITGLL